MINNDYEILFVKALCVTVAVEAAVIIICIRLIPVLSCRITVIKSFAISIIPSVLTLPYLWFLLPVFITDYNHRMIIGEIFIFLFEIILIKIIADFPWRFALMLSFLANSASIAAGLVVFKY